MSVWVDKGKHSVRKGVVPLMKRLFEDRLRAAGLPVDEYEWLVRLEKNRVGRAHIEDFKVLELNERHLSIVIIAKPGDNGTCYKCYLRPPKGGKMTLGEIYTKLGGPVMRTTVAGGNGHQSAEDEVVAKSLLDEETVGLILLELWPKSATGSFGKTSVFSAKKAIGRVLNIPAQSLEFRNVLGGMVESGVWEYHPKKTDHFVLTKKGEALRLALDQGSVVESQPPAVVVEPVSTVEVVGPVVFPLSIEEALDRDIDRLQVLIEEKEAELHPLQDRLVACQKAREALRGTAAVPNL